MASHREPGSGRSAEGERQAAKASQAQGEETAAARAIAKAHTRDSLQALSKLGEFVDGRYRIVSQPPVVVPARDLAATYGLRRGRVGER